MDDINVILTYKDTTVEFRGKPETVLESLHKFLLKEIPNMDLANKISLNYSLPEMINIFSDYIRLTEEGSVVIIDKISDRNLIALHLVASKIAKMVGKSNNDHLSTLDLQQLTNLKSKTISSRISELVKMRCVEKVNENGIRYKITTFGIHWLASELSKRKITN